MLINTFLDTEDFVHLYYTEDEPAAAAQGCGAGARMVSKYPPRPPSPEYSQVCCIYCFLSYVHHTCPYTSAVVEVIG